MSTPNNPLDKFNTFQVKHIMAVFPDTSIAETHELKTTDGKVGDKVGLNESGRIIVNEFEDDTYAIQSFVWQWNKTGAAGGTTTSMGGYIDLSDRTGGQFIDWFKTTIIPELKNMSVDHMTFVLKTYFSGVDKSGIGISKPDVIHGNPLIFHVHNFSDIMNSVGTGTSIRLTFTSAYNTTAQQPTVSKPYQLLLTHKSGELTNVDPEIPNGICGTILSRAQEDVNNNKLRKIRLDKSKPMRTLKEAFEALETDLNQQPEVHNAQLQTWMSHIRDSYVHKIKPPKQERGEKLPISFVVNLDSAYNEYKLDNRNLPFEQTEEVPDKTKGVTSINFRAGATLVEIVDTIMRYSIKVGEDAGKFGGAKTYVTNLSHSIKSKKIIITLKVKQVENPRSIAELKYDIPYRQDSKVDTGPGEGAVNPLHFTFKSGKMDDHDITFLRTSILTDAGIIPLEKPVIDSKKKPLVIFGNRETQTGERIPESARRDKFFEAGYSGLRLPIVSYLNSGLENAEAAANIDIMNLIKREQMSDHEIEIRGNPYIMSDLHRLPSHAAELDTKGTAHYYKIPESYPMYITLDIFLRDDAVIGLKRNLIPPAKYFYQRHYEIIGITNDLTDGAFYQRLLLKKTDDII